MMDKQKVFDKVVSHLLTQNARSTDSDGSGLYRGNKGRMCAVGCLIKDEHYIRHMEGYSVHSIEIQNILEESGIVIESLEEEFMCILQEIHDDQKVENWSWALMFLGASENLKFNYTG